MEEIRIGEYVRTRGIIGKLARIEYDKVDVFLKWYVLDRGNYEISYVNKPYIEKHSFNLIDLIEVGDTVNKKIVVEKNENGDLMLSDGYWYYEHDIKTIITKEQMKSIEYEV